MFTGREYKSIDRSYFRVLDREEDVIVLMSLNTGHCWHLYKPYSDRSDCIIYHRHENQTEYHRHGDVMPSLSAAIKSIKKHDQFQIYGRWHGKSRA